ncbi:hypothetical protein [Sneathiella chinensis]|uniref:Uncharacterized protein n=1 Tax=Sneathiella chinensis TaxID=349750 RepID=A0ABQ5U536_9PROT|nr:hypothetical protein [Sneathiella chinensis]GLQ06363.1 hypothetical protein GCM10007924_15840 [Sneathiella chinensis]
MTEEEVPNTTFLKWVVIILGILIIGVASLIGVTIYKRATSAVETAEQAEKAVSVVPVPATPAVAPPAETPVAAFGNIPVSAPAGLTLVSVEASGNRLLLQFADAEGIVRQIAVVDYAEGKVLGTISIDMPQ